MVLQVLRKLRLRIIKYLIQVHTLKVTKEGFLTQVSMTRALASLSLNQKHCHKIVCGGPIIERESRRGPRGTVHGSGRQESGKWSGRGGIRKGLHRFGGINSDTGKLRKFVRWTSTEETVRGARTWAYMNLSERALEGTNRKDVLA